MFLRRYERRKNGKGHVYWALVESIRTARGSRQRVVAYLGDVKKRERSGWAELGRRLDQKVRPDPSLFDPPPYPEPADDLELVKIRGVRLERHRDFGDVWLEQLTRDDALVNKLRGYAGIGLVTACVLRAEIGDFGRFRTGKQLSRFCGLSPRNASSGLRQADAGLIKA